MTLLRTTSLADGMEKGCFKSSERVLRKIKRSENLTSAACYWYWWFSFLPLVIHLLPSHYTSPSSSHTHTRARTHTHAHTHATTATLPEGRERERERGRERERERGEDSAGSRWLFISTSPCHWVCERLVHCQGDFFFLPMIPYGMDRATCCPTCQCKCFLN